jgi:hypothetical protein
MKRMLFLTLFITLTSFLLVPLAFAKDSPDKITIWGPSMTQPIEIIDPETLKGFDPWNGQFLDRSLGPIVEEPQIKQTYHVFFYFRERDGEFREFYTFQYAPESAGRQGFIYLPREGEPWRLMNSQTIARANGWHYASEEWDILMQSLLESGRVSPTRPTTTWNTQIILSTIILISGAATIWLIRHRYPLST